VAAASRISCLGSGHRRDFCECAVRVRAGRSWHRVDYRVASAPRGVMEGVSMVFMTNVLSGFFFVAFSYWLVTARTRRQVLAAVLAGGLYWELFRAHRAHCQWGLLLPTQSYQSRTNDQ